jgi:hypothetical protein
VDDVQFCRVSWPVQIIIQPANGGCAIAERRERLLVRIAQCSTLAYSEARRKFGGLDDQRLEKLADAAAAGTLDPAQLPTLRTESGP